MGYYYADEEIFREIETATGTNGNRHPLTYILEAADDIAYKTADIEDAFIKKFISYHTLLEELKEVQGLTKSEQTETFSPADVLEELYLRGKEKNVAHPEAYAIKNWIICVQGFLIGQATYGFTSNYDDEPEKLESLDVRMVSLTSSNYKSEYHLQADGKSDIQRLYLRVLLVTDYICGMTDSYAKQLYQELKAMDWPWSGIF